MPIPGTTPRYEVRAKVRVGLVKDGRPQSTDYFVSDDDELARLCGDKPKQIIIRLPYEDVDECFRSGLAWWGAQNLNCYTEGRGNPVVAFRLQDKVDASDIVRSDKTFGANRKAITCRVEQCPHYGPNASNKECRPIGRLDFFLDGGKRNEVLRFESKGRSTIQRLEGFLMGAASLGDLRERAFILTVKMKLGASRYPVVTLSEVVNGASPGVPGEPALGAASEGQGAAAITPANYDSEPLPQD